MELFFEEFEEKNSREIGWTFFFFLQRVFVCSKVKNERIQGQGQIFFLLSIFSPDSFLAHILSFTKCPGNLSPEFCVPPPPTAVFLHLCPWDGRPNPTPSTYNTSSPTSQMEKPGRQRGVGVDCPPSLQSLSPAQSLYPPFFFLPPWNSCSELPEGLRPCFSRGRRVSHSSHSRSGLQLRQTISSHIHARAHTVLVCTLLATAPALPACVVIVQAQHPGPSSFIGCPDASSHLPQGPQTGLLRCQGVVVNDLTPVNQDSYLWRITMFH